MAIAVGDYVEQGHVENGQVVFYTIGEVTKLENDTVEYIEAHAFHPLWGGSNNGRGSIHHAPLESVASVRGGWRHVVKSGMAIYRRKEAASTK